MVGISLKTIDFMRDDNSISLRQFASLCRERRYKEAAKFVATIENVWDVWPLMRSMFREWARDATEMLHDVDAYYVTGLCRRYGMGVKKDVTLAMRAFRIAGKRGHVDACILGALQVDTEGNIANWIVPGKVMPGMGGAMDLVVGAKHVVVAMEHTAKGDIKIMKKCTLPLTGAKCVDRIVTEMAVIDVTDKGLVLIEYNPKFTIEEIQANTEAELILADDLKPMITEV